MESTRNRFLYAILVFQVSTVDTLKKQGRQEDHDGDGDGVDSIAGAIAAGGIPEIPGFPNSEFTHGTFSNVGQILQGVLGGGIRPVLAGGAAFIPAGDLRTTVDNLLQNTVAPSLERFTQSVRGVIFVPLGGGGGTRLMPGVSLSIPTPGRNGTNSALSVVLLPQGSANKNGTSSGGPSVGAGIGISPWKYIQEQWQGTSVPGEVQASRFQNFRNRFQSYFGFRSDNDVKPASNTTQKEPVKDRNPAEVPQSSLN